MLLHVDSLWRNRLPTSEARCRTRRKIKRNKVHGRTARPREPVQAGQFHNISTDVFDASGTI
jgi:hypothetical protein